MNKTTDSYKSSNNAADTAYYIYTPEKDIIPKAILQIVHGMYEYIECYEELAEFMTANGVILCGNDHQGHGKSIKNPDELGYFGSTDGEKYMVEDARQLYDIMRRKYRRLAYVMLGHGTGSLVLRQYMIQYGLSLDGAIICGTGVSADSVKAGIFFASLIAKLKGKKYRGEFLKKFILKNYRDKSYPLSYLTADTALRRKYQNDPLCSFDYTAYAYRDILKLSQNVSSSEWFGGIPRNLPVLITGGEGEEMKELYERLKDSEINDAAMQIYGDPSREAFEGILKFIEHVYEGVVEVNKI